jgi:membrane dipeptidase
MNKRLIASTCVLAAALGVAWLAAPGYIERGKNRVIGEFPGAASGQFTATASKQGRELHPQLFIADLHADSLLWGRDLLARSDRGHVDLPRLIEGNVALQVFTVVSKTPRKLNVEHNDDSTDNVLPLSILQGRPFSTWTSLTERALEQAVDLHDQAARSNGRLSIIRTRADLARHIAMRKDKPQLVAALLGMEGMHALEGRLENVDVMFDAGFRMMAPTHFFDNEVAGSAHGIRKGGLTPLGRQIIQRMEQRRMLVDLAHASPQTIDDVLAVTTRPVLVSHTGVRGTCDNPRNLSDEQLRRIARTGGVIGIGYWATAVCSTSARAIARAIRHAVTVAGVDHVGLGSDFDGGVAVPFDTSGLIRVTDSLIEAGFSADDIRKIMGGNVLRLLSENLP